MMSVDMQEAILNAKIIPQVRSGPISKAKPSTSTLLGDIGFAGLVILMVIFFVPMSWNYYPTDGQTANWSDKVMAVLVSPEFAYGEGSAHGTKEMAALYRNIATMKPHMQAGSVAVVVGLAQFSPTLQFKYPVVHRSLGRLYGLCMAIVIGSSASFLFETAPRKEILSGEAFGQTLSMLTTAVPATMLFALQAIWKGDISSHREFMTLNYSMMLSAPLLRVVWILLAQVWDETKTVINLFSTLYAGPLLIIGPIIYLRRHYSRPANAALADPRLRLTVVTASLIGLVFCAYQLPSLDKWAHPLATFMAVVPPFLLYAMSFAVLAKAAKRRNDMAAYTAWTTYQNGLLSAPA
jgi:uncharacterized membrane protein